MKKVLVLLLLFIVVCGGSSEETVVEETTTTTVQDTTTTTIPPKILIDSFGIEYKQDYGIFTVQIDTGFEIEYIRGLLVNKEDATNNCEINLISDFKTKENAYAFSHQNCEKGVYLLKELEVKMLNFDSIYLDEMNTSFESNEIICCNLEKFFTEEFKNNLVFTDNCPTGEFRGVCRIEMTIVESISYLNELPQGNELVFEVKTNINEWYENFALTGIYFKDSSTGRRISNLDVGDSFFFELQYNYSNPIKYKLDTSNIPFGYYEFLEINTLMNLDNANCMSSIQPLSNHEQFYDSNTISKYENDYFFYFFTAESFQKCSIPNDLIFVPWPYENHFVGIIKKDLFNGKGINIIEK